MTKNIDLGEIDSPLIDASALCMVLSNLLEVLADLADNNNADKNNHLILYEVQHRSHAYTALIDAILEQIAKSQSVIKEASE